MKPQQHIEQALIEWKGKTISSPEHLETELRITLEGLVSLIIKDVEEMRISWDISKGDDWVVLIWKGTKLVQQLDKNSDDGGYFSILSLLKDYNINK